MEREIDLSFDLSVRSIRQIARSRDGGARRR